MQDKINSMCVDRIFELEDNGIYESFVIVLNNNWIQHPYTVIRGHKKNLNKAIWKNLNINLKILYVIYHVVVRITCTLKL